MAGSTFLLQHLRQTRRHPQLVQAASDFCCKLIAEACTCGEPPVISLQCLLEEASALLLDPATLPCRSCMLQHVVRCAIACSVLAVLG